ncbi:MAG: class I SAM-dependent methyltransferase [Paracoccaceae bacterium]
MSAEETPLLPLIRAEIRETGPMSAARYMELCLAHPKHGYYVTRDPLGEAGDFTTAPEISQMFGEMIGVWTAWIAQRLRTFRLIELGPGRGTLMADALRAVRGAGLDPEVWFVETSPVLRKAQAERVPDAHWVASLREVPEGPFVLVANEFLDALPVHQYLRTAEGWRERLVGIWSGAQDRGGLDWGLSEPFPGQDQAAEGAWLEISPQADAVLTEIADRLKTSPGAALIVDYGYTASDRPGGLTMQAVQGHARIDPLEAPGASDLTWLIDFDVAAAALPGAQVTSQADFLASIGIGERAMSLAKAKPEQAEVVADALERLTAAQQMGTLFKVLGVVSEDLPTPPGFGG